MSAAGAGEPLSAVDYRARLAVVEAGLRAGDFEGAAAGAHELLDSRVEHDGETTTTDGSVLSLAIAAHDRSSALTAAARIAVLLDAYASDASDSRPAVKGDRPLLDELRRAQAIEALPAGGSLPEFALGDGPNSERLLDWLAATGERLADKAAELIEWVLKFWPHRDPNEPKPSFGITSPVTILVAMIAALLAILAVHTLSRQRRQRAEQAPAVGVANSARDDDPLSREANEWETYARELAAAGRHREAIRAFYHAVLVTLYRSGTLHYRKGQTNWEYVARISPDRPFRGPFIQLTRLFEREWYGHHASGADALAICATMSRTIISAAPRRTAA